MEKNIPVWCGGMLESGIGRAHNIALTTLPNFILPGDTAGSSRYWEKDIISPEVIVENGLLLCQLPMVLVMSRIVKQWIHTLLNIRSLKLTNRMKNNLERHLA